MKQQSYQPSLKNNAIQMEEIRKIKCAQGLLNKKVNMYCNKVFSYTVIPTIGLSFHSCITTHSSNKTYVHLMLSNSTEEVIQHLLWIIHRKYEDYKLHLQ